MLYHLKSAVKFGGSASGIPVFSSGISVVLPVVYQCFPVVYHWKSAEVFGITSGIPVFSSGISVVSSGNQW